MGAKTIMQRIKDRFTENLDQQDWDVPTEIYTPNLETINTELVTKSVTAQCSKCGMYSHLKDETCIRCDRGMI